MTILLVGYRGSGKSTIGKRLANELWYKFHDTDAEVCKRAGGKTVREIFEQHGEPYFRELEAAVVADACKLPDHVVALGGGAIVRDETRALVKSSGAKVIYLKCAPDVLLKRIQSDPETGRTRPPLTSLGGGIEEVEKLLAEREPLYREVAAKELDVTYLGAEEAARYVVRLV